MSAERAGSAVIVAGGDCTRFNGGLKGGEPKHLYPIAGKSLLLRGNDLVSPLSEQVIVVANERTAPLFREHLENGIKTGSKPIVVAQKEQIGVANAIVEALHADLHIGKSVVVVLGDNFFDKQIFDHKKIENIIGRINSGENVGLLVVQEKDDPFRYAIISFDADGSVSEIVEKPQDPKTNLAVRGFYVLPTKEVLTAYEGIQPSARGEYEIGTLLNKMLQNGIKFELMRISKDALARNIDTREAAEETSLVVGRIEQSQ